MKVKKMGEINTKVSRLKYTRAQMNEPAAVQLTCYGLPSIIPWLSLSRNNVGPVAMTTKQAAQHYSRCIYSDDNEAVDHVDGKGAQRILTWGSNHSFPRLPQLQASLEAVGIHRSGDAIQNCGFRDVPIHDGLALCMIKLFRPHPHFCK